MGAQAGASNALKISPATLLRIHEASEHNHFGNCDRGSDIESQNSNLFSSIHDKSYVYRVFIILFSVSFYIHMTFRSPFCLVIRHRVLSSDKMLNFTQKQYYIPM